MKPEPEPCSTCGRRRNCGKKSSKPGGNRWLSARSTCCDLMNTTAGFTCSATETNASPRSATAFGTAICARGGVAWAVTRDSAAPPFAGRSSVDAKASPKMKAIATKAPNLSQSRVLTDIVISFRVEGLFLFVVVHDLVIGVDDVLFLFRRGLTGGLLWTGAAAAAGAALGGVERRAGRRIRLLQLVQGPGDLIRIARPEGLLRAFDRLVEPVLQAGVELVDPLFRVLLYLVHHGVEAVATLDLLAAPLVLGGVGLRVLDHLVDVLVAEARRRLDADLLLLAGRLVLRRHVQDAVGVDVERDLDLRHAPRSGRNPLQLELPDRAVVERHLPLALEHVDLDRGLVVLCGREDLRLLGRNGRVPLNEHGRDPAQRFDSERQRRDVEQQDVLHLAREHAALDCGADRHDLVRVYALVGLLPKEALHDLLHLGHPDRATYQDHLGDLRGLEPRILQRRLP